jgi:hypothetical protein
MASDRPQDAPAFAGVLGISINLATPVLERNTQWINQIVSHGRWNKTAANLLPGLSASAEITIRTSPFRRRPNQCSASIYICFCFPLGRFASAF